jgi:hypothetical protein
MSITLQPEFFKRCALQQQWNSQPGLQDGLYTAVLGDYTLASFVEHEGKNAYRLEDFLKLRTYAALRCRERQGRTDPVRVIDVGAGVGATMLKLASVLSTEVTAGKLEVYATTTHGDAEDYFEAALQLVDGGVMHPIMLDKVDELYNRTKDGIMRLTTDMSAAKPVPDELQGSFDIVHERHSVTPWSCIPEVHIMRMGQLAARDGIYMVNRNNAQEVNGLSTRNQTAARLYGVAEAHAALQTELGMQVTDHVEMGDHAGQLSTYRVFKGPDAMPVFTANI